MPEWQKTTVKEQVYDLLKQGILTQKYQMGERLNIGNLTETLGVSNSPLREAIHMLITEGLVVASPNATVSVVNLTPRDMYELSQMLCYLLVGAYGRCVEMGTASALAGPMSRVLETQRELMRARDLYQFVQAATQFDRCIIQGTGNARLLGTFDGQLALFSLAALYDYQHRDTDWSQNTSQHGAMVEAVAAGRHQEMVELIRRHYDKAYLQYGATGA